MFSKRKSMAFLVGALLLVLFIAGTFAWTNFYSQMVNEWRGLGTPGDGGNDGNLANRPGGTLHDNHVENEEYKSVFIENWGNENLFVRIKLNEYMEKGTGAGLRALSTDPATGQPIPNPLNQATPLISGSSLDVTTTWEPHIPYNSSVEVCNSEFHTYWSWSMGGDGIYFFPAPEDMRETPEYVAQSPHGLTADSTNELGVGTQRTPNATVITMEEWRNLDTKIGNFWVVDTDGWAYWASSIRPGRTTGLLINGVTQIRAPEEDYFYGIHVQAQMATRESTADNGDLDNFRAFGLDINGGWTEDGQYLMNYITEASTASITLEDITALQAAWGEGLVAISSAYANSQDYASIAQGVLDTLYGYVDGPVLFKPTVAQEVPFRFTEAAAASYFIGGIISEDTGFALNPWTAVRFGDDGQHIINGDTALWMGSVYLTNGDGEEIRVEKSLGFYIDNSGNVRLQLHHSSVPYGSGNRSNTNGNNVVDSNVVRGSANPITLNEITALQTAWGDGLVAISSAYAHGNNYASIAQGVLDTLYGYVDGPVLFKPTVASEVPFRFTEAGAASYFIGGIIDEDTGFALNPWTAVRFCNNGQHITNGETALWMGSVFLTDGDGEEIRVEKSLGLYRDDNGDVRIQLHHSSVPFSE